MIYKLGYEVFKGCVRSLVTRRYEYDASNGSRGSGAMEQVGMFDALFYVFQIVGMMLPAQLIVRFKIERVQACALIGLAFTSTLPLIIDAAAGGTFRNFGVVVPDGELAALYGKFDTIILLPLYCLAGCFYGAIDANRKIIPKYMIGDDEGRLRWLASILHIFYEIAGTLGNFANPYLLIPMLGNNFSFIPAPFLFSVAAGTRLVHGPPRLPTKKRKSWFLADTLMEPRRISSNILPRLFGILSNYGSSPSIPAGKIIVSSRACVFLPFGYSLALFGHRYLEDQLANVIATNYFGVSEWAQIIVAGANFGEMAGAGLVLVFTNMIQTPQPWLRLDAVTLVTVWYVGFWYPPKNDIKMAWIVAATYFPVCIGWAAGDTSVTAYIQALLANSKTETPGVSPLGSVMGLLQVIYVSTFAAVSPQLGKYVDKMKQADKALEDDNLVLGGPNIHFGLKMVGGMLFTVLAAIIFLSTFIP